MKLFNFEVCRVTTHTHTPYGRTALISAYLLVLCFLCATPIQAQTTHINNITVEAGGKLHIEVIPPSIPMSAFMSLTDGEANTQFAGKTLRLAGIAGNIAALFTKLKAAQPANIILTEQTGDVPISALSNITWLQSFRADKMTGVGDAAFVDCANLTSVTLPAAKTIGDDAFASCANLTSVSLPEAKTIGDGAFGGCSQLASVSLPEATSIGVLVFNHCQQLASVSLPEATSIGVLVFNHCQQLASVSLPKATTIGNDAFAGCSNVDVYLSEPFYSNPIGHPWNGNNINLLLIS